MSHRRDPVDAYAETQVLDPQTTALQVRDGDPGNFALYDEYVRELEAAGPATEPSTESKSSGVRGRR